MSTSLMKVPAGAPPSLVKRVVSLQGRAARMKEKHEEVIESGVRTATIAATAVAMGFINGQNKEGPGKTYEIGGVPVDLLVAGLGHAGALLGFGGRYSSHLRNFGDGALASYLAVWGRGMGAKWRAKQGSTSGHLGDHLDALLD